jgi:hypothetical protein
MGSAGRGLPYAGDRVVAVLQGIAAGPHLDAGGDEAG